LAPIVRMNALDPLLVGFVRRARRKAVQGRIPGTNQRR